MQESSFFKPNFKKLYGWGLNAVKGKKVFLLGNLVHGEGKLIRGRSMEGVLGL